MGSNFLSKKSKVKPIEYKEWEGNEYTDRARTNVGTYGDWIDKNWESAVTAPKIEDYYDYVKQVNEPAMNDFLQGYNTQSNALASRNYNRFGGLNSTPALYTQDMYNKQMNDLATRQASRMLQDAYGMKNTDWSNQLKALGTVYGMYDDAGKAINSMDIANWNIQNQNIANATNAENYNNANKSSFMDYFANILGGSSSGAMQGWQATGSPWGAIGGGIAGGIGGFADTYSGTGNQYTSALLSPFSSMNSMKSGMGGLNLNNKMSGGFTGNGIFS